MLDRAGNWLSVGAWGTVTLALLGIGVPLAFGSAMLGLILCLFAVVTLGLMIRALAQDTDHAEDLQAVTTAIYADDPVAFVEQFSVWLGAKRAALPDWPSGGFRGFLPSNDPALLDYKQRRGEVERQARVEYHERFRKGVLPLLGKRHAQADDPRTIEDLEAVRELLLKQVEQ